MVVEEKEWKWSYAEMKQKGSGCSMKDIWKIGQMEHVSQTLYVQNSDKSHICCRLILVNGNNKNNK